jgi:hypothetical protein
VAITADLLGVDMVGVAKRKKLEKNEKIVNKDEVTSLEYKGFGALESSHQVEFFVCQPEMVSTATNRTSSRGRWEDPGWSRGDTAIGFINRPIYVDNYDIIYIGGFT